MRLEINRLEGLRNDLLLRIERSEISSALLSIPHRDELMRLPGMPRHRAAREDEIAQNQAAKPPMEEHLKGMGIANERFIAICNRNLGNNHGFLAWQRGSVPHLFRIQEDPCDYGVYSCLTTRRDGVLGIEDLELNGGDVSADVEWATFGQRVLRDGNVVRIEEIIHQFYDARHVLAFGSAIATGIYDGYPQRFCENVMRAWKEQGVPRARYYHSAVGFSNDAMFLLQREGTVEEIGQWLKEAGADNGIILDNGGSAGCWVWWANAYAGGFVSPTIDYRPTCSSVIAFLLKGPARSELPGGSVAYSVL